MYIKCVLEWAVASACLESCVFAEECVILLFLKEYAGLRVKDTIEKTSIIRTKTLVVIKGVTTTFLTSERGKSQQKVPKNIWSQSVEVPLYTFAHTYITHTHTHTHTHTRTLHIDTHRHAPYTHHTHNTHRQHSIPGTKIQDSLTEY